MGLNSTATQRRLYAPACKDAVRQGALEAFTGLDHCLKIFSYVPRRGVTGCRSCRRITGGSGYSLHAYFINGVIVFWNGLQIGMGVAIDINWDRNPYGKRLVTDMPRDMVEAILAIRTNNGEEVWGWGGNYRSVKDAMHYEIACSPADLATGINFNTVRGWDGKVPEIPLVQPVRPVLRKGSRGRDVEFAQDRLIAHGHDLSQEGGVDGVFGAGLQREVKAFQAHRKARADGVIGPETWALLERGHPRVVSKRPVLRKGSTGDHVHYLQERINAHSPPPRHIAVDGAFGTTTHTRVKQFQQAKGLAADGVVGPATWSELG